MEVAVAVSGFVAEAGAWWVVAARRASLWRVFPVVLAAMAVAAAIVRPPVAADRVEASTALTAGIASGVALYLATRSFVALAVRHERFRRATARIYAEADAVPIAIALLLSVGIVVPSEELFWRGLVQARLDAAAGPALAALLTWLALTVANIASRSLPIVLGAAVGGALWASLAWWSGGILASLVSHILWTGLMIGIPPAPARSERAEPPERPEGSEERSS